MSEDKRATYDELLRLALERGFFFPSAEIYNESPAGFWEYGPTGLLMRNNFIRQWRRDLVHAGKTCWKSTGRSSFPRYVFEASGHLSSLVNPIVQCVRCGTRIRADKYIAEKTGLKIDERLSSEEFQELITKYNLHCPKCGGDFGKPTKFNMMFRVGVGPRRGRLLATRDRPEYLRGLFTTVEDHEDEAT